MNFIGKCWAYGEDGRICGAPAVATDLRRGIAVCSAHDTERRGGDESGAGLTPPAAPVDVDDETAEDAADAEAVERFVGLTPGHSFTNFQRGVARCFFGPRYMTPDEFLAKWGESPDVHRPIVGDFSEKDRDTFRVARAMARPKAREFGWEQR